MWYNGHYFVASVPTEGQVRWWVVTWEKKRQSEKHWLIFAAFIWAVCWGIGYCYWFV